MTLLEVDQLSVRFGRTVALDRFSLTLAAGETVALVGESGSGKSTAALAIAGLLSPQAAVTGTISVEAKRLTDWQGLRQGGIAMVFQDAMSALNPVHRIGAQVVEALDLPKRERRATAARFLEQVGLPQPDRLLDAYPHELSGGMRQRVGIAIAIAQAPRLLIADEPTTALDVTIQAQILALLQDLKRRLGLSLLLVTHDLGVVAETAERVAVLYAGCLMELAPAAELFASPRHPYTQGLLQARPPFGPSAPMLDALVEIPGQLPRLDPPPPGCRFAARCPRADQRCREVQPDLRPIGSTLVACHHA
jgi:oligopeptide/dipeptide ABC transporter ATP-binding protein